MGWKSKSERAKKLHRPSLKDWTRDGLSQTFPAYARKILHDPEHDNETASNSNYQSFLPFGNTRGVSYNRYLRYCHNATIPHVLDAKTCSPLKFHQEFESYEIPCVIKNIPQGFDVPLPPLVPPTSNATKETLSFSSCSLSESLSIPSSTSASITPSTSQNKNWISNSFHHNTMVVSSSSSSSSSSKEDYNHAQETQNINDTTRTVHAWKALDKWTLSNLRLDKNLRYCAMKCGEDDDGKSIRMKLKYFMKYLENNHDDSPLYVFDSSFDDNKHSKQLLKDYRVPSYFTEDLFRLVGENRRPPYRWFLIGPERSGTCVHIDPLGTSAWNTLIQGVKRWVLFPPHVPKRIVKGKGLIKKHEDDEAIHYFMYILPRIKNEALRSGGLGYYKNFECYEFTQYPGETVFIPSGWWHAVLNITHSIGVTQNFCSQRNFDVVWRKTRTGRKRMAAKWLYKLDEFYPHLGNRARELNVMDNFKMKYSSEEERRKDREKLERKQKSHQDCGKDDRKSSSLPTHQSCHDTTINCRKEDSTIIVLDHNSPDRLVKRMKV